MVFLVLLLLVRAIDRYRFSRLFWGRHLILEHTDIAHIHTNTYTRFGHKLVRESASFTASLGRLRRHILFRFVRISMTTDLRTHQLPLITIFFTHHLFTIFFAIAVLNTIVTYDFFWRSLLRPINLNQFKLCSVPVFALYQPIIKENWSVLLIKYLFLHISIAFFSRFAFQFLSKRLFVHLDVFT